MTTFTGDQPQLYNFSFKYPSADGVWGTQSTGHNAFCFEPTTSWTGPYVGNGMDSPLVLFIAYIYALWARKMGGHYKSNQTLDATLQNARLPVIQAQ